MDQILIQVDYSDFLNIEGKLISALKTAIQEGIATSILVIRDRWYQEAQKLLKSSRTEYLLGLSSESIMYPYEGDPFVGAIFLQGELPNMLESGFKPFDMKPGFQRSPMAKRTKGGQGWYLTIPFRHSTPGSFMYGKPMDQEIYNKAKKLQHWTKMRVKGGEKTSWTGYKHKANIYDSLTRITKQYARTKQSQYMTFRRASSNSDPLSWMHPGFSGVHIAERLESYSEQIVRRIINTNIKQVLGG